MSYEIFDKKQWIRFGFELDMNHWICNSTYRNLFTLFWHFKSPVHVWNGINCCRHPTIMKCIVGIL